VQPLPERADHVQRVRVPLRHIFQQADAPHALSRLRLGNERRGEKAACDAEDECPSIIRSPDPLAGGATAGS
jgi:hypothetical protein